MIFFALICLTLEKIGFLHLFYHHGPNTHMAIFFNLDVSSAAGRRPLDIFILLILAILLKYFSVGRLIG